MLLVRAKVGPFKSIDTPQEVKIDPNVTVLVGMNEAGKTVFLQALQKSADVLELAAFDPIEDYPRKDLNRYQRTHANAPAVATALTYRLDEKEAVKLSQHLGTEIKPGFEFTVSTKYDNTRLITISTDEKPLITALAKDKALSTSYRKAIASAPTLRALPKKLEGIDATDADKAFLDSIQKRINNASSWLNNNVTAWEAWHWLEPRIPRFLYFGDYEILPSKMNLADLAARLEKSAKDPSQLGSEHRGVLALLRMADISLNEFSDPSGLEDLIARIEAVSINLTDQVMAFWKQNENLEVRIDIRPDPKDSPPFNNGPNLYIRIANRRHRGVSTPFQQRSRGFIWFFSFLVWFDSVQHQLAQAKGSHPLILLLDEPGLSLHALAQSDYLRYIDDLSERHQVLYTTHSPFMVHSDRLEQVRVVEDQDKAGTIISDNMSLSNEKTLFPLQAALGWTVAQNLFISKRNLLIEGPSDLIYLKVLSALLESQARTALRPDVTLVPVGGLDKVVTFVALLHANNLQLAVLHDYRGAPEQKLIELVKQKLLSPKGLLDASQFRDVSKIGTSTRPTDTEDLLEPVLYLEYFNRAYAAQLAAPISESDLPPGDRIVERIERYLRKQKIQVRPSGGYNHYLPASAFAANPPTELDDESLARFEALFKTVNDLF